MKTICAPISEQAKLRLDFDENIEGDLIELNISQSDYEALEKIDYFNCLNKHLGLLIDNYEDESISYEDLPKALDLTIEYSYKYSGLEELWCSIKKIILTAIENKTAVFFFF
ncbi:hypothetical protein F895_01824 [Acinetobacter sp. CIP 64.2]|uniref:Uncharacterized protein n=2 Tax=Acinetobacter TaxID=469 RepID=S3TQN3_9GAMM|nr:MULTISPECIES: hypothetical protein [Acinetobacter]ENX15278.1 hypothetical protein F895_01824 [Acinetobacter sp. CIP 64.2]EPG38005.1 hypothetical protein F907_01975 [Acinetobacter colistiniresistens]